MKKFRPIAVVVLAVLVLVVVLQNTESVRTKLLFVTVEMPRALLLLVTMLVGVVVGLVAGMRLSGKRAKE